MQETIIAFFTLLFIHSFITVFYLNAKKDSDCKPYQHLYTVSIVICTILMVLDIDLTNALMVATLIHVVGSFIAGMLAINLWWGKHYNIKFRLVNVINVILILNLFYTVTFLIP